MNPHILKLYLDKRPESVQKVRVRQCDHESVWIRGYVVDGDEPADLEGMTAYIEIMYPDGTCVSDQCQIDGSEVTYTFNGRTAAVPGIIELAYIALKQHADDGTQTLCATTQAFAIEVLPDAASEGCGIAEAYSSEIVEMLLKCRAEFDADQAERTERFKAAMDDWGKKAIDAADRANDAADKVDEALSGNLDPLFKTYLDALKNVEGGFPSWETYLEGIRNAGTPDDETIEKDEDNRLRVKDYGIPYGKLAGIPFPFLPNVWELEDLTIRCGTLTNAGAGWNTFKFPEPFEAPPSVTLQSEGNAFASLSTVDEEGFVYQLLSLAGGTTVGSALKVHWMAIEDGRTA